jgi:hypothetical protein
MKTNVTLALTDIYKSRLRINRTLLKSHKCDFHAFTGLGKQAKKLKDISVIPQNELFL